MRKVQSNMPSDLPPMMQKYGIKADVMLHLDPGHKVIFLLDAPNSEAVRDFIYASGLGRWNDFEFYMTSSLEEIKAWTDPLPTIW